MGQPQHAGLVRIPRKGPTMTTDPSDARMCLYFYEEKGSVENSAEWPRIRSELLQERPEIVAAVDNLKIAERTLTALLQDWISRGDGPCL